MKLILCLKCQDVFKLSSKELRSCSCGHSSGHYLNDVDATYSGEFAIPIGFANSSLAFAVRAQPEEGMGQTFEAFVIPKKCPTMRKLC